MPKAWIQKAKQKEERRKNKKSVQRNLNNVAAGVDHSDAHDSVFEHNTVCRLVQGLLLNVILLV